MTLLNDWSTDKKQVENTGGYWSKVIPYIQGSEGLVGESSPAAGCEYRIQLKTGLGAGNPEAEKEWCSLGNGGGQRRSTSVEKWQKKMKDTGRKLSGRHRRFSEGSLLYRRTGKDLWVWNL